ncbi:MAG: 50S ribosomal L9 C-terminal domain-containing protein, partial [Candidatus Margulisiibacteriota bacterium]
GKLYGSITPSVIVEQIKAELPEIKINASDVIIEEGNIKYVGKYDCKAQFTKDISASFVMNIESDESHEQPELLESIIEGTEIIEDSNDEVSADEEASDEDATESVDQITETGEDADANEVSDEAEVPETDQP